MKRPLLYLARHGQTVANVPGAERVRGWGDWALTAAGQREAAQLGARLAKLGVGHVATDQLLRTRQTADAVARACACEPVHDPGLNTWNVGAFEGAPEAEAKPRLLWYVANPQALVAEGERYADFFARWRDAFWYYLARVVEERAAWALIVHSGQFATLDDLRLERGPTPTPDYDPPPGTILALDPFALGPAQAIG